MGCGPRQARTLIIDRVALVDAGEESGSWHLHTVLGSPAVYDPTWYCQWLPPGVSPTPAVS